MRQAPMPLIDVIDLIQFRAREALEQTEDEDRRTVQPPIYYELRSALNDILAVIREGQVFRAPF